ncbi:2Fe-2S iron-sulfur cluster-binding protein [Nonomuraea pusilla]|uniref:Sarcosine oxidase subunit alpha n=1 Tax=Nonomuraea pusilla TaxID=46177 RepID=A0A1H7S7Z2_9ACTN|nr:sarcosine oxidase subunit alpha [Nonomuraea pusilla]
MTPSRGVPFRFDGRRLEGLPGDTLAAALLRNGVRVVGRSVTLGRPRGVFSAGPEEPNALVRVGADPMVAATCVELREGMEAWSLRGRGRLDAAADRDDDRRHDKGYLHCDVLVVGAGPAGLAAARAAGERGARVILLDDRPRPGGDLLDSRVLLAGAPALSWVDVVRPEARVLSGTTAAGCYDHGYVVAVERRARGERLWHIRARRVVLATGAHERSPAFPGNDRPGVMLASAARAYVNRYGVAPGRRAVVFACADSGYEAARDLLAGGVEVAAVVDPRPEGLDLPVEVLAGSAVTGTSADADGLLTGVWIGDRHVEADLLAVAGGWNPAVHLFGQAGGRLRFDGDLQAFVPGEPVGVVDVAGACRGVYGTAACVADGHAAGARAAALALGRPVRGTDGWEPPASGEPPLRPPAALWLVEGRTDEPSFVDLHRDVTVADVVRATGTGMRSVEHVKRHTTAGTGADQGKTSGATVVGVMAALLGAEPGAVGTTTFRPPYTPVAFAVFAGRDRGALSDPVRTTAPHASHVARGAVFEDVGQWKRPRFFPLAGESMDDAVLRECRAARTAVAAMDASTLGKIDIRGADAGALLDRIYTNTYSTLAVGACRYGVMCRADGMVFDDGTTTRLAEDHFLMTTTTGNAAAVLDWLEEWRQTEWPWMDVAFTSVTDHWATVAVVGPKAREVVAAVAPGAEELAFMRYAPADVLGVPGRVFRISFSGELAYEVNVPWRYGRALWEAVLELGAVPYGTEAMHVLRAEKGFPIVGQETDGTVTPQDLGMAWIVSPGKRDFVGRRSHARPDTAREGRERLVGLLPDDPLTVVKEGAQLVAGGPPSLGHVTSSYRSATLGRSFALAMARDVRPGDRLTAFSGGAAHPVTVVAPVFYDPDNARRDGEPLAAPVAPLARRAAAESPAAAYADRFAAASSDAVTVREAPYEPAWEVRGADPGVGLRLGPSWWLVRGESAAPSGPRGESAGSPGPRWVDVSGQRTAFDLSGPSALDVLVTGCPIDLHPEVFAGHAQTLLAKAPVILERRGAEAYRIHVRSSFAGYLAEWLLDAILGL